MTGDRLHLGVILASTRAARKGAAVVEWFLPLAAAHPAFETELLDLGAWRLPLFDEPAHPRLRQYRHDHTKAWSRAVDAKDAFVIVTPEYDHGPPGALTNALHYLVHEWAYKPAGFVSYGGVSAGTRAVQHAKLTLVTLRMVPLVEAVAIPFFSQHLDPESGRFDPGEVQAKAAHVMLDELERWARALRPLRAPREASR